MQVNIQSLLFIDDAETDEYLISYSLKKYINNWQWMMNNDLIITAVTLRLKIHFSHNYLKSRLWCLVNYTLKIINFSLMQMKSSTDFHMSVFVTYTCQCQVFVKQLTVTVLMTFDFLMWNTELISIKLNNNSVILRNILLHFD